jgi:hypothetical protein
MSLNFKNQLLEKHRIFKPSLFKTDWNIMFQSVFMETPDWERFTMDDVMVTGRLSWSN